MQNTNIIHGNWINNEPVDNKIHPRLSILPKRYRTISELTEVPLLSEDLNSITEPTRIITKTVEIYSEKEI